MKSPLQRLLREASGPPHFYHFVEHPSEHTKSVNEYEFLEINALGRFDETYEVMRKWGDEFLTPVMQFRIRKPYIYT